MIDNPSHKYDLEKSDPDPEVTLEQEGVEKATRRQFSADTKRRILKEYDACQEPGEKGALLRREGIYSSYITTWRRQQERGELDGLTTKKRGPKRDAKQEELSKVKDENRRLRERLRQAELIIEAQIPQGYAEQKISQILGLAAVEEEELE